MQQFLDDFVHHFLDHVDHLQEFARYPVDRTPYQRTSNPISTPAVTSNTEEFMDTWTSLFSDVDSSTEPHLDENLFGDETCIPILILCVYLYTYTIILMYTVKHYVNRVLLCILYVIFVVIFTYIKYLHIVHIVHKCQTHTHTWDHVVYKW